MADTSTKATVDIEINSQSAKRRLSELETKLADLNKKKAELERTGNTAGLVKIEKDIQKVSRQMNTARTNAQKCEAALNKLNSASPKELRMVLRQLQKDLNHIERGSDAWKRHVETIKRVKAEIKNVDAELREHEGLMSRINRKVNDWGMSIASAAAAFTGMVFTARQAVQAYADMEGEMANVRKFTGMTSSEVEKLNEAFKSMDTRTSREDLNKLAQEAGRLGLQSQDDVLGFVKAADQINVALDDLGEGATLTLSKLTDIFGDKDRLGVEQSLLAVGSVINELSQNSTASAPYLADFAQRLAGVGKQANMTIPQIMGFAAVLDSQGQAVEMSATALGQLIMKLFQDPAKIAKATGMDLQAFSKVMKEDTNEALLMLLSRLHELGDISVLAPVFDAMGTDGARASSVIAALAGNIDMVKQQQQAANVAFKEGTSVTKEYNIQNNTVQAQLDKAKKGFHEMAVELGQKLAPAMKYAITGTSAMMHVLSSTISFLSEYAGTIISTASAIGIYTVAVNASVIVDKLKVFWNEKVIASFKNLWKTIVANPYAALAAAIGVVIGVMIDLYRHTNRQTEAEKALNDVRAKAKVRVAEEKQQVDLLMAAAKNMNLTYSEQKAAVDKLNKIIPNFNGKINSQTRAFNFSTTALKNYNDQLQRLYELEGAKEKLKELGKARAELIIKKQEAKDALDAENKRQSEQYAKMANNPKNYATSQGGAPPASAFISMSNDATIRALQNNLDNIDRDLKENDRTEKALIKAFGTDLQRDAIKNTGTPPATPTSNITTGGGGGTYGGGGGSNPSNTPSPDDPTKKMKEEIEKLTADKNDALTKLNVQYRKGELKGYDDYVDQQYNRTKQYYDDVLAVYQKYGQDQSKEAADVRTKQADDEAKHDTEMVERKKRSLEQQRDADKMAAQMRFYEPDSEIFHNQQALDNELAKIDIKYLEKVRDLTVENTKERADAELALEKAKQAEKLRQRKQLEQNLSAWLYIYSQQDEKSRMDAELRVAKQLYDQKLLNEEEYQEARAAIEKKYRDEVNSNTGTKAKNQDFDDAKDTYKLQLKALEDAHKQGLISQEDYENRKWQIVQNYHNKIMQLIGNQGSEWGSMVADLVETWKAGFDNLGSTLPEKMRTIANMAASAFAVMNAGIKSYTDYANASRDLEVKKVEQSYDAQIEAAGNNEKKRKQLEEQKQKDVAAIKTKYDKRAMVIEMAQAVASTALAAINAYSSAAQVPMIGYILAPIAASMALAAGALQIATIKKSHQAQQMGYYEGGFTGRDGNNRREVGVVHANEFVANHRAVANPELMPVLRLIDQAQRNNTVGSLTREDVSRAIGQGAILGDMTVAQQRTADRDDRSMQLVAASMEQQTAAINELNARLSDGIESFMVMDGERGFDRSWQRYQRMKNNPKR